MKRSLCFALSGFLLLISMLGVKAQTIQPIYAFTNAGFASPRNPSAPLVLGKDGTFYGTTEYGGTGGFGTVFSVTTNGTLTVLGNFDASTTGGNPDGGVVFGPDGALYGTAFFSGPGETGTIFRVTTNGVLTVLYSFSRLVSNNGTFTNSDGACPQSNLILGPDGYLYGTTSRGGTNSSGTVFKIDTNGALITLFSFDPLVQSNSGSSNYTGGAPYGALAFGPDGDLYGTTETGGIQTFGTVFRMSTNGAFVLLTNFLFTNGIQPEGPLTVGPDGNIYGTTLSGGYYGYEGTVFKVSTNGNLTSLYSFDQTNGADVNAGVTFGPDGNLYGTSSGGGAYALGNVFRLTTNGTRTTLASFNYTNGSEAWGGVTFAADGNLYGTTYSGGANGGGVIYRLDVGLAITNNLPGISFSQGGTVTLHLPCVVGSTNVLWVTTDLSQPGQWQALATNSSTSGYFDFTDTNTSGTPGKYYRISTP